MPQIFTNIRSVPYRATYCLARMPSLDDIDLTAKLGRDEYERRLAAAQQRFLELRLELGGLTNGGKIGPGLLVVVEGSDAGGKGGAIKRIVEHLDPRHYTVIAYAKPDEREKRHHYLWRFWREVPGLGGMCVFDRSWYGRVLVERIEGFATETEWRRAYDGIVDFERSLVEEGTIVVKFWLQVSQEEQLRRFEDRAEDPMRRWKLNDEDWRNRAKWDQYVEAIDEMFARTDHDHAPWNLISGEQKRWARVAVLETLNTRVEEGIERAEAYR
jgi:polyphosphate kinase 2 (PPK2 family)